MGRNNRIRSHRYIPNGKKKPKRQFNWQGLKTYANAQNKEKTVVILNSCLLFLPWGVLFGLGGLG